MQQHVNAHPAQRFNCKREQEIRDSQVKDSLIAPATGPNCENNTINTREQLRKNIGPVQHNQ